MCSTFVYSQPMSEDSTSLLTLVNRLRLFGERIPQEKVFVHMDNTCYFLGDTIWFSVYTRQTNTDKPSTVSKVLYAELWNHDGYLVERKLIEMKAGRGSGFFELYDTLYSGYFELRAYTRWQLNWGQKEHYHVWHKEYLFYNKAMAKDYYRDYEKLYSRVFPVYDKPKEEGDFYKDMTFRPLRRYFKNPPPAPKLRLSLFPEGGNLVAGVPCRVAFEAATSEGEVREGRLSLKVSDDIIKIKNEDGKDVDEVRTENRGRGTFIFTPEKKKKYDVVFQMDGDSTKNGRVVQIFKSVSADGVSLQIRYNEGKRYADIHVSGTAAEEILGLTVMHEGVLQQFVLLDSCVSHVELPDSLFPAGVNQLTVFDADGRIYADRLFFVTKPELAQPTLTIDGLKEQYEPFEQISLDVKSPSLPSTGGEPNSYSLSRSGEVQVSTLSLAVRDAVHQDYTFDSSNIMTEMLLSSEIKGFVPQPDYFFEKDDEEHRRALDLLMMTQGWRRFNWKDMAVQGLFELTQPAEWSPILTGSVHEYTLGSRYDFSVHDYDEHFNMNEEPAKSSTDTSKSGQSAPDSKATEYNVLGASSRDYEKGRGEALQQQELRFQERGNIKKEVRVHAEFVDPQNPANNIVGEMETTQGRFEIQVPNFYGECLFYLGASDTTKWKRKWDGFRRRKKHQWIRLEDDEYTRLPDFAEFYVRLNKPYPRFIKPYTFYQVHYAPMRDTTMLSPVLLTDGTHLMDQITVRAKHNGRHRIDLSKPAYVVDAYEAANAVMDAGLMTHITNVNFDDNKTEDIIFASMKNFIGDMGIQRAYDYSYYYDDVKIFACSPTKPELWRNTFYPPPGEAARWKRLEYLDKIYIYTDYSPRREGDVRYDQSNQPSVDVSVRRYPDWTRRATYVDRRYILKGFAYLADFYHPDYQCNPPAEGQKDYRRTLYWNPNLQLDANGQAHISFYNNSQTTQICVEANGQAADGTLLYSGEQTKR